MLLKLLAWFIPGGPLLSALATAAGAVMKFFAFILKSALDGLTKMLANPATFVTAGCLMLVAFGGGIRLGIKWDAHLVANAAKQVATLMTERDGWKGRYDEQMQRAGDAESARNKAEADAKQRIEAAEAAKAKAEGIARGALAKRVRDGSGDTKAGSTKTAGPGMWSLPSLPSLFGNSK